MENLEETEVVETGATEQDSPSQPETLEGQEQVTEKTAQVDNQGENAEKTADEVQADSQKPNFNPDEEVEIELGGKKFVKKQGEILELLEKNQGLSEREQKLSQLEKHLNRDYTQKTQQIAEFRKSLESSFGTVPDNEELKALGKVYKEYMRNPQAKAVIDQILGGVVPTQGKLDANSMAMQSKIAELEEKLLGFTSSMEEEKAQASQAQAKSSWDKWANEKAKSGVKITEEVDTEMSFFIPAIRQRNPDWDNDRILNEAYAIATRGQADQKAVKKVLMSVDEAKKRGVLKITPKAPVKAVKDQSYAELVSE